MKKMLIALGLSIAAFINANAQHDHSKHTTPKSENVTSNKDSTAIAGTAIEQMQLLYTHYIAIKEALVAGNKAQASHHANALSQTASAISYRDLSEGNVNALRKDASAIADAKDVAAQRKAFSNLSNNMSILATQIKLSNKPVYQQYCPMAKAYWLSNEKEIRNPYYGSSMLTCGSVSKTF